MSVEEDKPVLTGLIALIGVGLVVGLVAGLVVLAGTQFLGVGGDSSASDDSTGQQSLYLPEPKPTKSGDDPLVTLPAGEEESSADESADEESPDEETSPTKPAKAEIALSAGSSTIAPMERLDLTGTYEKGEGAILQVQRKEGNAWEDFPVTANVSGSIFSTYVQTGHLGINIFRVVDTDTGLASNEVRVRIG